MTSSPRNAGNSLTRRSAMQLAAAGATALAVGYRPRRARADFRANQDWAIRRVFRTERRCRRIDVTRRATRHR